MKWVGGIFKSNVEFKPRDRVLSINTFNETFTFDVPYVEDDEIEVSVLSFDQEFSVHYEFLEMITQYGYVILFAVVIPIAPLLAYVNNVLEEKIDLIKLKV